MRSFYAYYYKREMIHTNPTVLIDVPKIHEKSIIRLDTDEVAMLLDYIEHCGDTLTGQKRVFYRKKQKNAIWQSLHCFLEPESVFPNVSGWILKM